MMMMQVNSTNEFNSNELNNNFKKNKKSRSFKYLQQENKRNAIQAEHIATLPNKMQKVLAAVVSPNNTEKKNPKTITVAASEKKSYSSSTYKNIQSNIDETYEGEYDAYLLRVEIAYEEEEESRKLRQEHFWKFQENKWKDYGHSHEQDCDLWYNQDYAEEYDNVF